MAPVPLKLLYNQDPGVLFAETAEPLTPAHVDGAVDEVADAGVDVFLVNPNMWRTNYPSRVWETWWEGWEEWAEAHPPSDDPALGSHLHWNRRGHPLRYHMIRQMEHLAHHGCDYLERSLQRCRARGIGAGVSIRMNDQHDVTDPESQYWSDWYRAHPELRFPTDRPSGHAPLDYAHQAVREHFLALIREIVTEYPVEVLELDFLRHPHFFPARNAVGQAPIMTDFVAQVHALCAPRDVAVVPRVPTRYANALELGLDPEAWAEAGLIDGLIVSVMFDGADWQAPVTGWRARLGPELPLYVGTDKLADHRLGFPRRLLPAHPGLLRGFAAAYIPEANRPDGLYFFNFFGPREEPLDRQEPAFATLAELKERASLAGREKRYLLSTCRRRPTSPPVQLPRLLRPALSWAFTVKLMAEPAGSPLAFTLRLICGDEASGPEAGGAGATGSAAAGAGSKANAGAADVRASLARLWVQLNDRPLGPVERVDAYHAPGLRNEAARDALLAARNLPGKLLREGANRFVVRNDGGVPITIYGVEVKVTSTS